MNIFSDSFNQKKREKCEHKTTLSKCFIDINENKTKLLTQQSLEILEHVYNYKDSIQKNFANLASKFSINCEHSQRMYNYISDLWFMPSSSIIRFVNGLDKLPVSCFLNSLTSKNREDIISELFSICEQFVSGGGISIDLSNIEEFSTNKNNNFVFAGIYPVINFIESYINLFKKFGTREASIAYYLSIDHPEIESFINIRKPTFDPLKVQLSSKTHIGVCITDKFMNAVINNEKWNLNNRYNNSINKIIDAKSLWIDLLTARLETGEPYIYFTDNVKKNLPKAFKALNININCSNLCTEIILPTQLDHKNKKRSGICVLGSLNLEYFDEWKNNELFIEDCLLFLDNVIEEFINNKKEEKKFENLVYAAERSRSIGLGVFGFHSLLQKKMISFENEKAQKINIECFSKIRQMCDKASEKLAEEFGSCLDNEEINLKERFVNKIAIAPTSYISILCNYSSPGINLNHSNIYNHKNKAGIKIIKNKYLDKLINDKYFNEYDNVWNSIIADVGSIQNSKYFSEEEKNVFKTSFEIDQFFHIKYCSERQKYICQSQSCNLFFDIKIKKKKIHDIHIQAWKDGLSTLYYLFASPEIKTTNKCINCES